MTIIYSGLQPIDRASFNRDIVLAHLRAFNQRAFPPPLMGADFNITTNADITALVICPGPSHKETTPEGLSKLEQLIARDNNQKVILAGAGSGLLTKGILKADQVDGIVFNNPQSNYESSLPPAELLQDIPVYVATHCLPSVFEALERQGANIKPWNAYLSDMPEQFSQEVSVGTAYGAAVSGIGLMSAFGHKDFDVIGWDGSPYYPAENEPVADVTAREEQSSIVIVDGTEFLVHGSFCNDVPEFINLTTHHPAALRSLHVHGESSYNGALLNDNGGARTNFSALKL